MGWNGYDLVNEFSELLGDTSSAHKVRVTKWINDIQNEICTSHQWGFLKLTGQKILTLNQETQTLLIVPPTAPTLALAGNGTLAEGASYRVLITFYDSTNDVESTKGAVSSAYTIPNATDRSIAVSAIPVSTDPGITRRRLYLSKNGGTYYFSQEIANNVSTTATISEETSSLSEPPDYGYIYKIEGDPYILNSRTLIRRDIPQLRLLFQGPRSGTPDFWGDISPEKILVYPSPSSATTLNFDYYRFPKRIFNSTDSIPTIPVWLKDVLELGVEAKGFKYRDRDGTGERYSLYTSALAKKISETGTSYTGPSTIRDVVGTSDGYEL